RSWVMILRRRTPRATAFVSNWRPEAGHWTILRRCCHRQAAEELMQGPEAIIEFWFGEHGPDDWFGGKPEFDAVLAGRFSQLHVQVARGEAWQWRANPEGRLAELIVLDQFSRQLHRGSPNAYVQDM